MHNIHISPIDIGIMLVYIVGIAVWGLLYSKKKSKGDTHEGYFLAGRNMTWPIVGITLYAANMGSPALVGLAGDAYSTGISVFNYEWMALVVLVFFAIFFLPFYLRSKVYTMPEFLQRRFDIRSRYYFSFITLVGNIIIDTAGILYSGALIVKMIFPSMELWHIIAILALITAAYTVTGGLSAVMYTEAVQGVLLMLGAVFLSYFALKKIDFNFAAIVHDTPHSMLSLIRPMSDKAMPWLGLVVGVPLLGFYFWGTNQFMVQRVLSAKNTDHGRWGALFAGILKLPGLFIVVFPGIIGRMLYPHLSSPDLVYPTMLFNLLPVGILGIVLAGLIAAISSSISATLNSASTLMTMDFVSNLKPGLTPKQLVRVGQIFTGIFVVISAAWAPMIDGFPSLFKYLQQVLALISPPVVAVFLLGLFWKRSNATGAFYGLMGGLVSTIFAVIVRYVDPNLFPWFAHIQFLLVAPILLLVTMAVIIPVSLMTAPPPKEAVEQFTWSRKFYYQESEMLSGTPWYKNYRYQAIGSLILTFILVYIFR
ncbi:MAG: sodium:solute symporter [Bacteroidales bacterium]|nr:sodium:solute symporter [Bacteroidales bacterium]